MTTKHPAHGPVSLDRLHQISEILSKASAQSDGGNLGYAMADAVKVIDGAIAREQVRREHAVWSQATFGDVGPVGPLKHLSREALEAAAEPGDLSEWADMQFLLWDAQRRAGISDKQLTQAMVEKLVVNKQRDWPEPIDGEPRLHIKEQPAPVGYVSESAIFCLGAGQHEVITAKPEKDADDARYWDVIPLYAAPQPAPVAPETLPCPVHLEPGLKFGKGVPTRLVLGALCRRADYYAELEAMTPEQRAEHDAGIAEFKAMLGGGFRDLSQPVDPQVAEYEQIMLRAGWVMVPVEPTDEMIAAAMECDDVVFDSKDPTAFCVQFREIYCAMVDVAPKPELTSE